MKLTRLLIFICLAFLSYNIEAQDDSCPMIITTALDATESACQDTGRNQVCYGNFLIDAVPQSGVDTLDFEQQGDIADVGAVQSLTLSPLNVETNEWGVALMRIQANLPDTLPGQNVTLLLFGDVEIQTAVEPAEEIVMVTVVASSNANIRANPSTNAAIVNGLESGDVVTAIGRLADNSWLRVQLPDGNTGWIFTSLVTSTDDISTLNEVDPDDDTTIQPAFRPMQAFLFRSGIGDAACETAPESGILIQTPTGSREVTLTVNGVNITMGSTTFLQAEAPGEMIVNGLEDQIHVNAFDVTYTAYAGTRVRVPLDENSMPAGPPLPTEPYDINRLQDLPLNILERPIVLPSPLTHEQIDAQMNSSISQSFMDNRGDVQICNSQSPTSDPEVDITQVVVTRNVNRDLHVEVHLDAPLVTDYSFAVLLVVQLDNMFKVYIWEIHNGIFRIGETDPQTGALIPESDAHVDIDRETGVVSFNIDGSTLSNTISQLNVRSFHTPTSETQPQPTTCDSAGPLSLSEDMR